MAPRAAAAGRRGGAGARRLRRLQPVSLVALLATLVLLFGFQGEQIVRQPLVIALLAVPIIIQVYLNAGIAYGLNRALGVPHNIACPSALIGASNFFELAVAAAIALFGFQSGAALATVVGVLVEVPVMLSVVRIVLKSRGWYEPPHRLRMAPRARTQPAPATPSDAPAIAAIYNQGIADRVATFETEPRSPDDIAAWFTPGRLIMVAEGPRRALSPSQPRSPTARGLAMPASMNSRSMSRAIIAAAGRAGRCSPR